MAMGCFSQDWLRQLRYSYTEIFPHLNEQMSRPTHFEEAPDKREQFGTLRGMYARHGVPNVDSPVHHSEQ